ncbi:MAG: hypothetical protein K8W52_33640 [Deltaproteobacteria bacterium]|nr:hypothetical protein [Deltaproteobacteria bacterium]
MRTCLRSILAGLLLGGTLTGAAACKKSAQDQAVAAKTEAAEKMDEAAVAARDAEAKAAAAAKAEQEKVATMVADVRAELGKGLDAADQKWDTVKDKLSKATGKVKQDADAAAAEVAKRRAAAADSLAAARAATGDAFEAAKLKAQADQAALSEAIDSLESSLDKK